QSPIASFNSANGTWVPISIRPSAKGNVLSKTVALVKLRMEKLSSHFSGQGRRRPVCSYSTRILRANISYDLTTEYRFRVEAALFPGGSVRTCAVWLHLGLVLAWSQLGLAVDSVRVQQIDSILANLKSDDAPGAAVLVLENGHTEFSQGCGVTDL